MCALTSLHCTRHPAREMLLLHPARETLLLHSLQTTVIGDANERTHLSSCLAPGLPSKRTCADRVHESQLSQLQGCRLTVYKSKICTFMWDLLTCPTGKLMYTFIHIASKALRLLQATWARPT